MDHESDDSFESPTETEDRCSIADKSILPRSDNSYFSLTSVSSLETGEICLPNVASTPESGARYSKSHKLSPRDNTEGIYEMDKRLVQIQPGSNSPFSAGSPRSHFVGPRLNTDTREEETRNGKPEDNNPVNAKLSKILCSQSDRLTSKVGDTSDLLETDIDTTSYAGLIFKKDVPNVIFTSSRCKLVESSKRNEERKCGLFADAISRFRDVDPSCDLPQITSADLVELYLQYGVSNSQTSAATDSSILNHGEEIQISQSGITESGSTCESFYSYVSGDKYPWILVKQLRVKECVINQDPSLTTTEDELGIGNSDLLELFIQVNTGISNAKEENLKFNDGSIPYKTLSNSGGLQVYHSFSPIPADEIYTNCVGLEQQSYTIPEPKQSRKGPQSLPIYNINSTNKYGTRMGDESGYSSVISLSSVENDKNQQNTKQTHLSTSKLKFDPNDQNGKVPSTPFTHIPWVLTSTKDGVDRFNRPSGITVYRSLYKENCVPIEQVILSETGPDLCSHIQQQRMEENYEDTINLKRGPLFECLSKSSNESKPEKDSRAMEHRTDITVLKSVADKKSGESDGTLGHQDNHLTAGEDAGLYHRVDSSGNTGNSVSTELSGSNTGESRIFDRPVTNYRYSVDSRNYPDPKDPANVSNRMLKNDSIGTKVIDRPTEDERQDNSKQNESKPTTRCSPNNINGSVLSLEHDLSINPNICLNVETDSSIGHMNNKNEYKQRLDMTGTAVDSIGERVRRDTAEQADGLKASQTGNSLAISKPSKTLVRDSGVAQCHQDKHSPSDKDDELLYRVETDSSIGLIDNENEYKPPSNMKETVVGNTRDRSEASQRGNSPDISKSPKSPISETAGETHFVDIRNTELKTNNDISLEGIKSSQTSKSQAISNSPLSLALKHGSERHVKDGVVGNTTRPFRKGTADEVDQFRTPQTRKSQVISKPTEFGAEYDRGKRNTNVRNMNTNDEIIVYGITATSVDQRVADNFSPSSSKGITDIFPYNQERYLSRSNESGSEENEEQFEEKSNENNISKALHDVDENSQHTEPSVDIDHRVAENLSPSTSNGITESQKRRLSGTHNTGSRVNDISKELHDFDENEKSSQYSPPQDISDVPQINVRSVSKKNETRKCMQEGRSSMDEVESLPESIEHGLHQGTGFQMNRITWTSHLNTGNIKKGRRKLRVMAKKLKALSENLSVTELDVIVFQKHRQHKPKKQKQKLEKKNKCTYSSDNSSVKEQKRTRSTGKTPNPGPQKKCEVRRVRGPEEEPIKDKEAGVATDSQLNAASHDLCKSVISQAVRECEWKMFCHKWRVVTLHAQQNRSKVLIKISKELSYTAVNTASREIMFEQYRRRYYNQEDDGKELNGVDDDGNQRSNGDEQLGSTDSECEEFVRALAADKPNPSFHSDREQVHIGTPEEGIPSTSVSDEVAVKQRKSSKICTVKSFNNIVIGVADAERPYVDETKKTTENSTDSSDVKIYISCIDQSLSSDEHMPIGMLNAEDTHRIDRHHFQNHPTDKREYPQSSYHQISEGKASSHGYYYVEPIGFELPVLDGDLNSLYPGYIAGEDMTVSSTNSEKLDDHKACRNEPVRDPKCNSKNQKTYTTYQYAKAGEHCRGVNERVLPKCLSTKNIQTVDQQMQSNKEDTYLTYQNENIDCGTTWIHQNETPREGVPGNGPSNEEDTYKVYENSELQKLSDSVFSNEATSIHPLYFFCDISESILPTPPKISTDNQKNGKDNQNGPVKEYQKVSVVNESEKETFVGPGTNSTKNYTQNRVLPRFHCVPCTNGEYIRFVEKTAQGSTGLDFEFLVGDQGPVEKESDSVSLKKDNMFINVNQILTESDIPSLDEIRNQTGLSYDDVHELIHSRSNIRCSLCRRQNS